MNRPTDCDVSVIIPLLNEEASVPLLAAEIERAFEDSGWDWECLWIDDGSEDETLGCLRRLHGSEPRHRFFSLDRNYGQSAALAVGFSYASGLILATLDGDLQNDPADLPRLIHEVEVSDLHMINGVRVKRQDDWIRRLTARLANAFRNWVTGGKITDAGCSTRTFYRECVERIPVFRGMHRFLPTLVEVQGYRVSETPVNHRPRQYGRSKYGLRDRVWFGIIDTLGVRWLKIRAVRAVIESRSHEEGK